MSDTGKPHLESTKAKQPNSELTSEFQNDSRIGANLSEYLLVSLVILFHFLHICVNQQYVKVANLQYV